MRIIPNTGYGITADSIIMADQLGSIGSISVTKHKKKTYIILHLDTTEYLGDLHEIISYLLNGDPTICIKPTFSHHTNDYIDSLNKIVSLEPWSWTTKGYLTIS